MSCCADSKVLNPDLYIRLKTKFRDVKIANRGEKLKARIQNINGRNRLWIVSRGETYCVNCPFCGDTRQRLWINHRWGYGLNVFAFGSKLWNLAICYNENCLNDKKNFYDLRNIVFSQQAIPRIVIDDSLTDNFSEETIPTFIKVPDSTIPINSLSDEHPAVIYLKNRGFDKEYLWKYYKVGFCNDGKFKNRIFIPVYYLHRLVSWQVRSIVDEKPKYITCPRSHISKYLYGIDAAKAFDFCVLVEGVTDVWAIGPPSVAVFGSSLSSSQYLLLKDFSKIIVLMDPDASDKANRIIRKFADDRFVLANFLQNEDPCEVCMKDKFAFWKNLLRYTDDNASSFTLAGD